jgi:uncharacterized protein (UPF0264 family)
MSKLLASVTSVDEALVALEGGADIIDLKNPAQGALGALPVQLMRSIVETIDLRRPVSATIGDLPMQPQLIVEAIMATAATGVDIVKVGFFGSEGHAECIQAMKPLAMQGVRIVAVLFADTEPDLRLLPQMADAGVHGVMLDTATKDGKRLRDYLDDRELRTFVEEAHALNLLVGLAGSLAIADVPELKLLEADYLGFRGALCDGLERRAALNPEQLLRLRNMLYSCNIMAKEFA